MIKVDAVALPKLAEVAEKGTMKLKFFHGDIGKLISQKWIAGSILSIKDTHMELQYKGIRIVSELGENMNQGDKVLIRVGGHQDKPYLELRPDLKNLPVKSTPDKKIENRNQNLQPLTKLIVKKDALPTWKARAGQGKLITGHKQIEKQPPAAIANTLSGKLSQLFSNKTEPKTTTGTVRVAEQRARLLSTHPLSLSTTTEVMGSVEKLTATETVIALEKGHKNIGRISISTPSGIKVGDRVQLHLAEKSDNKSDVMVRKVADNTVKNKENTTFTLHQKLIATVERKLPDGQLILNINGNTLQTAPLKKVNVGDSLLMRVSATAPEPVLDVIDKRTNMKPKVLTLLRNQLPNRGSSIAQAVQQLKQNIQTMPSPLLQVTASETIMLLDEWIRSNIGSDEGQILVERLTSSIRHGGQHLEAQLREVAVNKQAFHMMQGVIDRDLKAIMIKIAADFRVAGGETVSRIAEQGIARIESQQAGNLLSQIHGDPLRIEFPLMIANEIITAKLSIQADQQTEHRHEKEQHGESYSVLFLLELQGLGKTHIDTRIGKDAVKAIFYHKEDRAADAVRLALPELKEKLYALGYKQVFLSSGAYQALEPQKQQAFQALDAGTSTTLLDVLG